MGMFSDEKIDLNPSPSNSPTPLWLRTWAIFVDPLLIQGFSNGLGFSKKKIKGSKGIPLWKSFFLGFFLMGLLGFFLWDFVEFHGFFLMIIPQSDPQVHLSQSSSNGHLYSLLYSPINYFFFVM